MVRKVCPRRDAVKNVFVIGLNDINRKRLERCYPQEQVRFHTLFSFEEVRFLDHYPVDKMLTQARKRLNNFSGTVDAIITFWDFPSAILLPFLIQEYGLIGASLNSVMKCEHKYWSRYEQQQVIPEYIPPFHIINPFEEKTIVSMTGNCPYWIKPVISASSFLAFQINDPLDYGRAIQQIRRKIRKYGTPFNYLLSQMPLPDDIAHINGEHCLIEGAMFGKTTTVCGYVYQGMPYIYGLVDSVKDQETCFSYYYYPSRFPKHIQEKMGEVSKRIISHLGYDNAPFNIEFFYNEAAASIQLLEINSRISESHCGIFELVDGLSDQKITVDLALGRKPDFPKGKGRYVCGGKFFIRQYEDALVTRSPSSEELRQIEESISGVHIQLNIHKGMRLCEMDEQDSYSYEVGHIYIGADSHTELKRKHQQVLKEIHLAFESPEIHATQGVSS